MPKKGTLYQKITSKTVLNCRCSLAKLDKVSPVTLHWAKAHTGHELNKEADRAAKFGTISRWTYKVRLPESIIKVKIQGESVREWENTGVQKLIAARLVTFSQLPLCTRQNAYLPQPHKYSHYGSFHISS